MRALDAPLDPADRRERRRARRSSTSDPDLAQLPIPRFFEHEGGPYITAGCIVARDPETGERNWSIARVRPLGGSRALVGIAPNHHLAVAARAARERGERLPIAVTIGNHPALMVAACLYLARGEDELRVAGALLGEPVELVRCRHVPLEVPAGCEIVLEGELDLDASRRGGTGLGVPRRLRALRPRRDGDVPVPDAPPRRALPGHPAGLPPRAHAARRRRDRRRASSGGCAASCRRCGPSRCPRAAPGGSRPSSRSAAHGPGDALTAARAALAAVNLVKLVTVVDDDVDPWDDAAVAHAVATRVHFDRDLHVLPGMRADRAEPLERDGTIAKLAIDATRHAGDRADWTPAEPPP